MSQHPRNSWLAQTLGRLVLKITGWKVSGVLPVEPRSVIIAAPHTSNWDFVFLIAATSALGVRIHWLGKDSLFNHPLGFIMHWFAFGHTAGRHSSAYRSMALRILPHCSERKSTCYFWFLGLP